MALMEVNFCSLNQYVQLVAAISYPLELVLCSCCIA